MTADQVDAAQSRRVDAGNDVPAPSLRLRHPFVVARVGGVPTSLIDRPSDAVVARLLDEIETLDHKLNEPKGEITAQLEQLLPTLYEQGLGARLIQLKRDVFNGRPSRIHPDLRAALPAQLTTAIDEQIEIAQRKGDLGKFIDSAYRDEVDRRRNEMRAVWGNDNLRNGVLCSSPLLYDQLHKIFVTTSDLPSNKKVAHACDSLLAYAARSALKASPLSSLTLLWLGTWSEQGDDPTQIAVDRLSYRRVVTAKASALLHALEPVWSDLDILGTDFLLTINPTMRQIGQEIGWSQIYRSSYHHEKIWGHNPPEITVAVQSVAAIIRIFRSTRELVLSAAALIDGLASLEGDVLKRRQFVSKLLKLQFLVPAIERFDQEPLLPSLLGELRKMQTRGSEHLLASLENIAALIEPFESATEVQRPAIFRQLETLLKTLSSDAGVVLPARTLTPALFEDCYVDGPALKLNGSVLEPVMADLYSLLELAPALDFNQVMQSLIAEHFIERFGRNGLCENVPEFLNNVMDIYFGPESEIDFARMAHLHEQQKNSNVGRGLLEVRKLYYNLLTNASVEDGVIYLDRCCIDDITGHMPPAVKNRPLSQSFTGHVVHRQGDQPIFVLNQILPGASGLMSRFFNGASPAEVARVTNYLKLIAPTGRPVEIPAVFGFNANLHPMLLVEELEVPGISCGYEASSKIPIRDLTIRYCEHADRIVLQHDGQPIDPVYLGFMAPSLLPRRIRPLTMTTTQNKILYISRDLERLRGATPGQVTLLPRVMVGQVCISRKMHVFPLDQRPDPSIDDCAFFVAVRHWRKAWDLPQIAFWRLLPRYPDANTDGVPLSPQQGREVALAGQAEFDPTAFKPAFIDFDDPIHVRIFRRALSRNQFDLAIEEALPGPGDHDLMVGHERHLCELQFELSRQGRPI